MLMHAMAVDMFFAARPLEAAVVTVEPGHALSKLVNSLVPLHPSQFIRRAQSPISIPGDSSIWKVHMDYPGSLEIFPIVS